MAIVARRRPQKSVSLHTSIIKKIEELAVKEERTFSDMTEKLIERYFLLESK